MSTHTTIDNASLMEAAKRHPAFQAATAGGYWVSLYASAQLFGGPEEGGWWYTRTTFAGSIGPFPDEATAQAALAGIEAEAARLNEAEQAGRARAWATVPDEDQEPTPANCPEGYIPTGFAEFDDYWAQIETASERGQADNSNEPRPHYE